VDILFVTGNALKAEQAVTILVPYKITVRTTDYQSDEIQAHDPERIGLAKAKSAFEYFRQPLVVNDHFWSFSALNGFPGGYMKDVNQWFSAADFIALMKSKKDRSVTLTEHVVYIDDEQIKHFKAVFQGIVLDAPKGKGLVPSQQVIALEGSGRSIAEHIDNGEPARNLSRSAWPSFGKWYSGINA
jgi:non-canonical purine NTP pyrophosphatase (RdgB/HAM1 family)